MAILESLARGLPVLTTYSAPWNAIKVNNAGWIIPNNYSKLINILRKIFITDKNIFHIKSNNAIKLAKKYSWKNVAKIYEDTYRNLLK
jgi:glycosyltransferase involved in cell wall biosynthesis